MKANDIIFQAEKFVHWHGRTGGDLETNFRWWAQGKDFQPEDEAIIWAVVTSLTGPGADEPVAYIEGALVNGE